MNRPTSRQIAARLGALALLGSLCGCVVLPFGHDDGEHRSEHGERDHLYPRPHFLPSGDAGDTSEIERVRLAPDGERAARRKAGLQPAVYLLPAVPARSVGLLG